MTDFYGCSGKEPAGRLLSDDGGKPIFFRKDSDHLRCARRVPIDKQDDIPVVALGSEAFRLQKDGGLAHQSRQELEGK